MLTQAVRRSIAVNGRRILRWILPALAVLLFGAFVWPTMYRYHRTTASGRTGSVLIRENRVTGSMSMLRVSPAGAVWRVMTVVPPTVRTDAQPTDLAQPPLRLDDLLRQP